MHVDLHSRAAFLALFLIACFSYSPGSAAEPVSRADEERAIRRQAKEYLAAIESGDGEKIASFWTADGDYIDEAGHAARGSGLAREARQRPATQGAARQLAATVESIRFITPTVAIEDGALSVSSDMAGAAVVRRYTAVWAKQNGKWLLDGVRELGARSDSAQNRLNELSWMLGEWISDDGKTIRLSCEWSPDKHFLLREVEVSSPDGAPLRVTQRIGWDAHEKQLKSWNFDSEGGFSDGLWFHQDGRWIVESASVLPDGRLATGANVYALEGDDAFVWESKHSEIDGEPQPDRTVRMVRKSKSKETSK